jgi:DNA-binding CsgD family transcriptional regulator
VNHLAAGQLFGRDREVERIAGLVAEVASGQGAVVWVAGEPGIGKSALLREGLSAAAAQGCRVLWTAADELGQQFPLSVLLDGFDEQERAEIVGRQQDSRGWGTPGADPVLAEVERLIVLVERLCVKSPVVLVLDDLQWADGSSLLVWHRLSRSIEQLPLLLVSACRPVPRRSEVVRLRAAVEQCHADVIALPPLSTAAVEALVDMLVGGTSGPHLRRLAARAGGNPLYVRELVVAASREGRLHTETDTHVDADDLPSSLSGAINSRLGFLSDATREVLRGAALLGHEFSVPDLATVLGRLATEMWVQLEEAMAAGVLVEVDHNLAFAHQLVREAMYETIPVGLRSALHHQAAKALSWSGAPIEQIAAQLMAAPDVVDFWTLNWIMGASPELTGRAPAIAVELLCRAIDRLPLDDPRWEETEGRLVVLLRVLCRYEDTERLAREALARTAVGPHRTRMAAVLAHTLMGSGQRKESLEVICDALADAAPDDRWTPRLRALLASFLPVFGRAAEAESVARQALAEAEAIDDAYAVGLSLHALSIDLVRHDSVGALELMERGSSVLGDDAESIDLRLLISCNRTWVLRTLDRVDEANVVLSESLELAERTATPRLQFLHSAAASHRYFTGDWDDASAEIEVVIANVDDLPEVLQLPSRVHGLGALLAVHRDDRPAVAEYLDALRSIPIVGGLMMDNAVFLMLARAHSAERAGEPAEALAHLLPALEDEHGPEMILRHLVMPMIVRLTLALGDRATAAAATDACIEHAERDHLPIKVAAANRCRGLLANDPRPLTQATTYYRTVNWPLELAETLEDLAVVQAGRGDLGAAKATLGQAVLCYQELGAVWDITRAEARLRPYGVRKGRRGSRQRPSHGWLALTPTELRVAKLVAVGYSNPDIAAELFLSRRTVQTHVSHILAKLNAKSRKEIAQEAHRQDAG